MPTTMARVSLPPWACTCIVKYVMLAAWPTPGMPATLRTTSSLRLEDSA
jgi:hypothetical protein